MYQRGGSSGSVMMVIILGVLIGVGYLIYDRASTTPQAAPPVEIAAEEPSPVPVAAAPIATPTVVPEITAGARLVAPTAGINAAVVTSYLNGQSWDVTDLGVYAGHLQGTAWLQQTGNVVLAGHVEMADGRKGVFAGITDLKPGDPIILTQNGVEHVYVVSQMRTVEPNDLSVVYPTSTNRLTLITCSNYNFLDDVYSDRLVIIAEKTA